MVRASLAITISCPTSASGIIILSKTPKTIALFELPNVFVDAYRDISFELGVLFYSLVLFAISVVRVFSGKKCNLLNHGLPDKHLFDNMYSKMSKRKTQLEPSESKINSKLYRETKLSF